jgi:hypothetical protein
MLPIAVILELNAAVQFAHDDPELQHRSWLARLDDAQLQAGRWRFPGSALRDYLAAALKAAEAHPYSGVVTG